MKEFPPFRLDTVNQCLWRRSAKGDDERILLTPKAFAVVRHLVDRAGQLVTHDELLDAVWPNTHIQPQAIKKLVLDLRNALGDKAKKPLFIETLHRRGYRFVAAVSDGVGSQPPLPAAPARGKLVGREQELSELSVWLEKAQRGERQIVFITGEPGIGKTALADAFQRQAASVPGLRIARGQCVEGYGGKEAYYPILEALGDLCRGPGGESVIQTLAAEAPTWLVQFPALVKREQREMLQREILGATRERMLREIGDALETLTAVNPLLLVFEDLQWVDNSTVDLISALARGRASAKLMVIATKRPVDIVIPEHPLKALKQDLLVHQLCQEITLEPLGETEVTEYLAAESSGGGLPEGLAELVYRHSEGNPLFMVAALDHMTERGFVSREGGAWKLQVPLEEIALEVPQKLRRMIEAQMDQLKPEEQRALEAASVAGSVFLPEVCAAAADLVTETLEDVCEQLARRHHIVRSAGSQHLPDGTISARYEFVHALYREVSYRRLTPAHRATLHQHIGERIESLFWGRQSEVAPELAHHFEEASDWSRAVKYLQLQAEVTGRRYVAREVAVILQDALELLSNLSEAERARDEIEILEKLAAIYLMSFDVRAIETYEALRTRAAHYGLVDVEVRALIGWARSWVSAPRCLEVVEQTLRLSAKQSDPVTRATTRMCCFVDRLWANGWNPQDAEECRNALAEICGTPGDRRILARHLVDYSFVQWISSEYRAARRSAGENLAILFEGGWENPHLTFAYWKTQGILTWILLFLGEWGEALSEIRVRISMADRNGLDYRGQLLRLYQAWVHLNAMDFLGVVKICESVLPFVSSVEGLRPLGFRNFALIVAGTAETALGNCESARKYLSTALDEMDRQTLIFDWYFRMLLGSAMTELSIAQRELAAARIEAERFLNATLATAERTWQALAWEANARVAMALLDLDRARDCIANALSTMEGFEVPLAEWRVHATAAELYKSMQNSGQANQHRELSRVIILKLADSLPAEEPLRRTFLSAPSVRHVIGNSETTNGEGSRSPTKGVKRSAKKSAPP